MVGLCTIVFCIKFESIVFIEKFPLRILAIVCSVKSQPGIKIR